MQHELFRRSTIYRWLSGSCLVRLWSVVVESWLVWLSFWLRAVMSRFAVGRSVIGLFVMDSFWRVTFLLSRPGFRLHRLRLLQRHVQRRLARCLSPYSGRRMGCMVVRPRCRGLLRW